MSEPIYELESVWGFSPEIDVLDAMQATLVRQMLLHGLEELVIGEYEKRKSEPVKGRLVRYSLSGGAFAIGVRVTFMDRTLVDVPATPLRDFIRCYNKLMEEMDWTLPSI